MSGAANQAAGINAARPTYAGRNRAVNNLGNHYRNTVPKVVTKALQAAQLTPTGYLAGEIAGNVNAATGGHVKYPDGSSFTSDSSAAW